MTTERINPFAGMNAVTGTPIVEAPKASPVNAHPVAPSGVGEMKKVTVKMPAELIGKVRSASIVDGAPNGIRGLSAWVAFVLEKEVLRVEEELGQPLSVTPSGVLPSGWL